MGFPGRFLWVFKATFLNQKIVQGLYSKNKEKTKVKPQILLYENCRLWKNKEIIKISL